MDCPECRGKFAAGFLRGRDSVWRENKSGCVCIFVENEIIKVCDAHRELIEEALRGKDEQISD